MSGVATRQNDMSSEKESEGSFGETVGMGHSSSLPHSIYSSNQFDVSPTANGDHLMVPAALCRIMSSATWLRTGRVRTRFE